MGQMPGLEGMDPLEKNHATRPPLKCDGQLMLGLGGPHQRQHLPEPNRSQCVSLLGKMLLGAVKAKCQPEIPNQP
jgi:hypothetical protein